MRSLIFVLSLSGLLFAQSEPFKIVPDSTMDSYVEKANAVVLSDENIVIVDDSEIEYIKKCRIRINNKSGLDYGRVVLQESEFRNYSYQVF